MSKGPKQHGELVEWEAKHDDLGHLARGKDTAILKMVYDGPDWPQGLPDAMRKWKSGVGVQEEQYVNFFGRVARYLDCPEVGPREMMTCSHSDFRSHMHLRFRHRLERRGRANNVQFSVDFPSHPPKLNKELVKKWLEEEIVDQRFTYTSRVSVDKWNELIDDDVYDVYRSCKNVLGKFLKQNKTWATLADERRLGSVVMLGAGAFGKDREILRDLLRRGFFNHSVLRYAQFDSSFYMLTDTLGNLERWLGNQKLAESVQLVSCCGDFLKVNEWHDVVRPHKPGQHKVLFILGATVGNLDETRLLDVLERTTKPGDLLVVANHFAPNDDEARVSFDQQMKQIYGKSAHGFLLAPVRDLLDKHQFPADEDERAECVDVTIETDIERIPRAVRPSLPKTVTVVFRLNKAIDGCFLALAVAKKFTVDAMRAACKSRCFDFREEYADDEEPTYKYLVFERTERPAK